MRSIYSTALMATGAAAIMIPPNVALNGGAAYKSAISDSKANIQTFGVDPFSQLVKVPCPGCPFAQFGEKGISWTRGQENYLVLNISVASDKNVLELNGAQFYPPTMGVTPEPEVLQVPASQSLADVMSNSRLANPVRSLRVSSWSMHAGGERKSGDNSEELLKMHIQIQALENYPVSIPEVEVTAIKTHQAGLLIVNAQVSNKTPEAARRECQGWPMLCQWRKAVAAHVQSMKSKVRGGCHKMRVGVSNIHKALRPASHHDGHHRQRPNHQERPHMQHKKPHHLHEKPHHSQHKKPHHSQHKRPHHGEHHHEHMAHHVINKVARVLLTIVIPILFGVLAGMLTYLIGMLVGTGVAMLWHAVRGRKQRYSRIQLVDSEDEEDLVIHDKEVFVDEAADVTSGYSESQQD